MAAGPALRREPGPAVLRWPATVLAAGLLLAGCGLTEGTAPGDGDADQNAPVATEPASPGPSPDAADPEEDQVTTPPEEPTREPAALPTGPVPTDLDQQPRVRAAISELAQRLDVPEGEVAVAGWAEVTWPDGSLGCPQEGMMYTQALVPGEQLVLRATGELFSYHAAQGEEFAYCADPRPPVSEAETS